MAGLQHDAALMQFPQGSQEFLCDAFDERELRRELDEYRSEFVTEPAYRVEELQQSAAGIHQLGCVGDCLGRLDSEAEVVRRHRGPAFPGSPAMRPMKAGVDLHTLQTPCIKFKVRKFRTFPTRRTSSGAASALSSLRRQHGIAYVPAYAHMHPLCTRRRITRSGGSPAGWN
jgi:hypothetical protein